MATKKKKPVAQTEFRKTVRLTPAEEKVFQSILKTQNFGTENKVFKYFIATHDGRLKNLKFQESKIDELELEIEKKDQQLQEIQDAFKTLITFTNLKL